MEIKKYRGVFAASPTPFDQGGKVDAAVAETMTEYYIENGLTGIFALSSTGEYFAMPDRERERMAEAVICTTKGRIPVLVMVSDACLERVLENIRRMSACGADGVVLTAPCYYRYSQEELEVFFMRAAEASRIPLWMYNQPIRLPNILGEKLVMRLAAHPNILGLKDTGVDAVRLGRLAAAFKEREDFVYYAGSEGLAAYAALLGVSYVYALACVEPKLFVSMQRMAEEGNVAGLVAAQHRVDALCRIFQIVGGGSAESFSNFVMGIKAALEQKGIGRAYTAQLGRLPLEAEYAEICALLKEV